MNRYRYALYFYGYLINGQKVLVTLIDIQVFLDILILNGEIPDKYEEKISEILSSIVKSFKMEYIKAFSFHRYFTEKVIFINLYKWYWGERESH